MATIIRSTKSSSDWTNEELIAFNITISPLSPDKFFPTPDPSLGDIDPVILDTPSDGRAYPTLSNAAADYLDYLDFATSVTQESSIDSFVIETLKLLGYNERHAIVSMRYTIPFTSYGEDCVAQPDVCLIHNPVVLLPVLAEYETSANAEARVVAEAIAAFQFNNMKRREHNLNPLDAMTIPCIKMSGTRPTFYLVPITAELSNAVMSGEYPKNTTQVLRCVTKATNIHISTGMGNVEYRKLALKRLLAFKELAKSHWVHVLEGI